MLTVDCKAQFVEFYHGTSVDLGCQLLPPSITGKLSEEGRKKNLDRVFFTADRGLARVYAGRAKRSLGGSGRLYRVVCPVDLVCLSDTIGATVYHARSAFVELIEEF